MSSLEIGKVSAPKIQTRQRKGAAAQNDAPTLRKKESDRFPHFQPFLNHYEYKRRLKTHLEVVLLDVGPQLLDALRAGSLLLADDVSELGAELQGLGESGSLGHFDGWLVGGCVGG